MAKIYRFTLILIIATAVFLIPSTFAWFSQSGNTKGQLEYNFSARSSSSITITHNSTTLATVSGKKLLGCMNASKTFGEVQLSMLDKFDTATASNWVNSYGTTSSSSSLNAVKISASFTPTEKNLYATEINVTPTIDTSSYDKAAAEALSYVVYMDNGTTKTLLDNNAFTYYTGSDTKKAVITRDGYFEGLADTTYTITAIVWLDGFASAQAESGGANLQITIDTLDNLYTPNTVVTFDSSGVMKDMSNVPAELKIPPAFYYEGTIKEVSKLKDSLFRGKTSLVSVTIPDTVRYLGNQCFQNCTNLERVTLGNKVGETGLVNGKNYEGKLGYRCFENTKISSVIFGNPYAWIGYRDFVLNLQNLSSEDCAALLLSVDGSTGGNGGSGSDYDWEVQKNTRVAES